jgi:hypothetical protein
MKPIVRHFVRIDAYPLFGRNYISPEEAAEGFTFKIIDGKPGKYRFICDNCFLQQETTSEYRRGMKKDIASRVNDKELRNSFWVQEMCLNT